MHIPELLAPAGSLEKLKIALTYGADAVYCGVPAFSLRARENPFTLASLRKARKITAEQGKKLYVTVNIYPRSNQLRTLAEFLKKLNKLKPDAIIFSDFGVFELLKKHCPKIPLHLSVQANTVNSGAVKFWHRQGVKRIILARELSLKEIQAIHKSVPKMELEIFVHGAICMSYSGRCLLSLYLTGRDANQGVCSQPCRWKYTLTEEKRENEPLPVEEDQHGTYILNSKDMCLIEHLDKLAKAGVCSLKIEGRHKTVGYLATVVRAYRKALDDLKSGKKLDKKLLHEVKTVGHREFTMGFFDGSQKDLQNYERSKTENPQTFLGMVEEFDRSSGRVLFAPRNRFELGDKIEIMPPGAEVFERRVIEILDKNLENLDVAHGGQEEKVWIHLGSEVPVYTLLRKKK